MLLNAVIIILREVIEASLIISLFLAFSQHFNITRKWLPVGLPLGVVISFVYALNINFISDMFDGVGQDVLNACIHLLIYFVLLLIVIVAFQHKKNHVKKVLTYLMFMGVVLASIREGSEILLYIEGFLHNPDVLKPVLFGSAIGTGIGISSGVFFYYSLVSLSKQNAAYIGFVLCLLVAGGMILQATQLLTQADWIESQYPVWDTSAWISEGSIFGQLLYALVGYESTPTLTQVISYFSALGTMILAAYIFKKQALRMVSA